MWHTPRFPGRILFSRAIAARPARGAPLAVAVPGSGWNAWKIAPCSAFLTVLNSDDSGPGSLPGHPIAAANPRRHDQLRTRVCTRPSP